MNNQYTYNQPPMGQMMPPPQMPVHNRTTSLGWRGRWMRRFGMDVAAAPLLKGALTIPNWVTGKAIVFFFVAMFACWLAFGNVPSFELWIVAAISVVLFFYGGEAMSKSLERKNAKTFVKNIFIAGFVIRFIWILYCYFYFNQEYHGNTFGDNTDTQWYVPYGQAIAEWIRGDSKMTFGELTEAWGGGIDDVGYPMWLGIIYLIVGTDNDVFIPMIVKCIVTSYCAVSVYNMAKRHFGEGTARMAAIFVCINPNMIYWCGNMFKEAEMVFLTFIAVDNFDRVLSSGRQYTFKNLLPGMLAGIAVFFFRAPLALLIFLAVFAHIVMASNRVMSTGKKILAGLLVVVTLGVAMGDRIKSQTEYLLNTAQSDHQKTNMEWRSNREGGNSFAKYAGAAVFAPLIFTIPFPTFNTALESQFLQVQLSGGSYIKNILSFFVILVMFMMLISGEWRRHVFILAYTVGYHVILVMSEFAQSGRFHMPVWPMILLFAAYGIQIAKTNSKIKRWFSVVLVIEVVVCIVWNWFKLKGRGMI